MQLPYIQNTRRIISKPLLFSGLNRKQIIDDSELSNGKNLNTETLPALSPRKPHKAITGTIASTAMLVNDKLVMVSGTSFYYDGVARGTLTAGSKSMVDFNGKIVIFPDKKYYDYGTSTFGSMTCPYDIDYATVHYNRIFGIKGNNIYASKLGEFDTWEDYSGTELDSWATDVEGHGDFTGITTYQDHVVFFKRDQMFELYGYTPSQFRVLEVNKVGCIDFRSIAEVSGTLIFASEEGILTYAGGVPRSISDKLNIKHLDRAVAGTDGRNYFATIAGETYSFDSIQNTWLPYMSGEVNMYARGTNKLYFATTEGVYELGAGTEYGSWEAVTKEYDEGIFNKLSLKSIKLKLRLDPGSEVEILVRLDGKEWVQHKIIKEPETSYNPLREVLTTIPMKRSTTYQIMLRGQGRALVWGEREYYIGSEKA